MSLPSVSSLLAGLVALPSVNPSADGAEPGGSGEALVAGFLADFWAGCGVDAERRDVFPGRPNLVAMAEVPGTAPLLLEAHMDTVPPDPADPGPSAPRLEAGRLHGRGACDDKASLAAMAHAVASAVREGSLARTVIMAATADEEHSFAGAAALIAGGLDAAEAVVGEPTALRVVIAHKGAVRWRIGVRGRAAHSSAPEQGDNAIYRMARLVAAVEEYGRRLQSRPPHPLVGGPTVSVGTIRGGSAVNVVPDYCEITVDRRTLPGEDLAAVEAELEAFLAWRLGADFPFEAEAFLRDPALEAGPNEALARRLVAAAEPVIGSAEMVGGLYGTNASKYAAAGIPSVVFGPGDPAQCHAADEWVELAQVEAAAEVFRRLLTTP
jgi:acetylornithine deacetylase